MGLIRAALAPFICAVRGHDWMSSLAYPATRRCRRCRLRQIAVDRTHAS